MGNMKCRNNDDKRQVAIVQLQLALLDIPAFVTGLVTLLTLWRSYALVTEISLEIKRWKRRQLRNSKNGGDAADKVETFYTGSAIHRIIFWNFSLLAMDFPFLLLVIFLIVFGWRAYILKTRLEVIKDFWLRRKEIAKQALLVLFDLPAIACAVILLISWRSLSLIRQLRQLWEEKTEEWNRAKEELEREAARDKEDDSSSSDEDDVDNDNTTATPPANNQESAPKTKSKTFHGIIFGEFVELLVDLPFVILGMLLLWRLPLFIRHMIRKVSLFN